MFSIGDKFISSGTGNVFEVSRLDTDSVKLDRIGIIRDGDYESSAGIHATVSREWLTATVKSYAMVPAVRLIGGAIVPEEEYLNGQLWRHERD